MTTIGQGTVTLREIRNEFGGLSTTTLATNMLSSSTFTSGAGTVTAPANSNLVLIHLIGGGGGGGRNNVSPGAGGGGGGAFVRKMATITPGEVISYTVGTGGTGRTTTNGPGTAGSATTTTGAIILSAGGGAGGVVQADFSGGANGGEVGPNADGQSSPGQLGSGKTSSVRMYYGGAAGGNNTFYLSGGPTTTAGSAGANYGGGGAGSNNVGGNGGNGAGGMAQFYFYNYPSATLTSYRTSGGRVPPHQNNELIPASGTIKIGDFRSNNVRSRAIRFVTTADWLMSEAQISQSTPATTTLWMGFAAARPAFDPPPGFALGSTGTVRWIGSDTSGVGTATVVALYTRTRIGAGSGGNSHFAISGRNTGTWWSSVRGATTSTDPLILSTQTGALLRSAADQPLGTYNSVYNYSYWDWTGSNHYMALSTPARFTMTVVLSYV